MKTVITLEIDTANAVVDFSRAVVAVGTAGVNILNGTYSTGDNPAAKMTHTPRVKFGWRIDVQKALKQYKKTVDWLAAATGYTRGTMRNYIYSNTHCSKKAHSKIMAAINALATQTQEAQPTA